MRKDEKLPPDVLADALQNALPVTGRGRSAESYKYVSAYRHVTHRADFQNAVNLWNEKAARPCNHSADSDGDYWRVAAFLLAEKDARIAELEARVRTLREALDSLTRVVKTVLAGIETPLPKPPKGEDDE